MKIAIVDDDTDFRKSLETALAARVDYDLHSFKSAKDALKKLDDSFDLVITDITMPQMDGLEFLREIRKANISCEAVMITANATLNYAIEALRYGAKDFLQKPFEIETLIQAIDRAQIIRNFSKAAPKAAEKIAAKPREAAKYEVFVASSPALEKVREIALKTAKTDASVLLLGESGVGKEVFAGFIHYNSPRAEKPFMPINMASIPETMVESELFGYNKGAFTDAQADKPGIFEVAQGGTIFLDEIAEMPIGLQSKLLRAIQEKKIRRLGSTKDIEIDARFIAATNQDIERSIAEKRFREDLYYRLNTIEIEIPPLRERQEEILPIANAVLATFCEANNMPPKKFSEAAKADLLSYYWHGNIRELIGVCQRAAIVGGEVILPEDLFLKARAGKRGEKSVADLERELLAQALAECGGDYARAAAALGMSAANFEAKAHKYSLN
ncbi:MAG: sigma-54 dependent transcriptional regulator [Helicobacteraceae bacterium]|nr:sigma-54 dependent transcriptional regulator [Helicobacteraceae bacterium]